MKCICKSIDELDVLKLVKEGFSFKDILDLLDKSCELHKQCKTDLIEAYKIIVREK